MEDNNTTNQTNQDETSVDSKPVNKDKKENKKSDKKSFSSLLAEYKGEFRKIVWPSKEDLIKQTTTVIAISLIVGAIIFGIDEVFALALKTLVNLIA